MIGTRHSLLLIGGPAACGKSTLVHSITTQCQVGYYRRNSAFFDCAEEMGIPREAVYQTVTPEQADKRFISECLKHRIMVSDVHYGVQLHRDQNLALGRVVDSVTENYVPTISDRLLLMCENHNISVTAVLLYADASILYERAVSRRNLDGKILRAVSLEDIQIELQAEHHYWGQLRSNSTINTLIINTSEFTTGQVAEQIKNLLHQIEEGTV